VTIVEHRRRAAVAAPTDGGTELRTPGRLGHDRLRGDAMRGLLIGLAIAVVLYAVTGGHLILLPLFFALPLGGFLAHRGTRRR
jgi:hypothetical protein